jgi:hypothetical protein
MAVIRRAPRLSAGRIPLSAFGFCFGFGFGRQAA